MFYVFILFILLNIFFVVVFFCFFGGGERLFGGMEIFVDTILGPFPNWPFLGGGISNVICF